MKKLKIWVALSGFALLGACSDDTNRVFEESASERIVKSMQAYQNTLTSAQHGWLVEYYPSADNLQYGGYTYTWQFSPTEITAILDTKGETAVTSAYQFISSAGIYLSFDQFNDNLHYFSSPSGGLTSGRRGDYEFMVVSHSEEEIILKGKKYQTYARLTRLKEPALDYMQRVIKVQNAVEKSQVREAFLNGNPVTLSYKNRNLVYVEGATESPQIPFRYTDKGIRFHKPLMIDGKNVEEILLDDNGEFSSVGTRESLFFSLYPTSPIDFSVARGWRFNAMSSTAASSEVRAKFNETKATFPKLNNTITFNNRGIVINTGSSSAAEAFLVNFYGSKTESNEVHFDIVVDGNPVLIKDFIIENAPYIVTSAPRNSYKLTSKTNPNVWFVLSR